MTLAYSRTITERWAAATLEQESSPTANDRGLSNRDASPRCTQDDPQHEVTDHEQHDQSQERDQVDRQHDYVTVTHCVTPWLSALVVRQFVPRPMRHRSSGPSRRNKPSRGAQEIGLGFVSLNFPTTVLHRQTTIDVAGSGRRGDQLVNDVSAYLRRRSPPGVPSQRRNRAFDSPWACSRRKRGGQGVRRARSHIYLSSLMTDITRST